MSPSKLLKALAPQLFMFSILGGTWLLAQVGLIPSLSELSAHIVDFIAKGGIGIVVLFSFLENLPGINAYFPGSIVLIARMATTYGNLGLAFSTYLAIVVPAMVANVFTYFLGTRFLRRAAADLQRDPPGSVRKVDSSLALLYLTTYWHPHLAAVTALASGARGITFRKHIRYFLPISISWSIVWAVVLYGSGAVINLRAQLTSLIYLYLVLWTAWDLRALFRARKVKQASGQGISRTG